MDTNCQMCGKQISDAESTENGSLCDGCRALVVPSCDACNRPLSEMEVELGKTICFKCTADNIDDLILSLAGE